MKKGLMPHHDGFPVSRDWEDLDCNALICVWNCRTGKCTVPSLCKIGEDGRCVNFKTELKGEK